METNSLPSIATELRKDILSMIAEAKSGHPGGSLSAVEILVALYFGGVMTYDPAHPADPDRDRFILAKGHGAPALYAVLAHAGYFPREELATLRKLGSRLQGHPDSKMLPGVEVSTGSLGQGLSIAAGMAAGLRLNGSEASVFTLLGDGECEEGQVWEAAMFAAHYQLDHLVAIIDHNGLQIDGPIVDVVDPERLDQKFESFGWNVFECDGHAIDQVIDVLLEAKQTHNGKPSVLIAHTVKGKGVSFMENVVGWHGKAPNAEELNRALQELSDNQEVNCG